MSMLLQGETVKHETICSNLLTRQEKCLRAMEIVQATAYANAAVPSMMCVKAHLRHMCSRMRDRHVVLSVISA